MLSVNTNTGAMVALQYLNKTEADLQTTQSHINSGLKVAGPKDNGAVYAIAQNMRGDIAGMAAVKTNLALGQSIVNVAIDAGRAIADLLTEMKAKAVQASQDGLDADSYTALNEEFTSLRAQIETIVATAEFNGKNLIDSASTSLKARAAFAPWTTTASSTVRANVTTGRSSASAKSTCPTTTTA